MPAVLPLLLVACTSGPGPDGGEDPGDTGDSDCSDPPQVLEAFEAAIAGAADACDVAVISGWIEEKRKEHGPWNQDVRRATSVDGDTFAAIDDVDVVETAGVPEAVVGDDGRTYLYHVIGDLDRIVELAATGSTWIQTHGIPGLGALGLEVSDDGVDFETVEDFEVDGIVSGMVVDPEVMRAPDGTWRLYYVAMTIEDALDPRTWEKGVPHDAWLAESTDLVHWTQRPDPVVHGPSADPAVSCPDGVHCTMMSFGLEWSSSKDGGEHFTWEGHWLVSGFAPDFSVLSDGSLRMYYNSMDLGAPLRSFRSYDGGTFVPEDGVRMETYGEAVTTVPAPDGTWNLYYHTFKDADDIPI